MKNINRKTVQLIDGMKLMVFFLLIIVSSVTILTGCSKDYKKEISGYWKLTNIIYTDTDGTEEELSTCAMAGLGDHSVGAKFYFDEACTISDDYYGTSGVFDYQIDKSVLSFDAGLSVEWKIENGNLYLLSGAFQQAGGDGITEMNYAYKIILERDE